MVGVTKILTKFKYPWKMNYFLAADFKYLVFKKYVQRKHLS